MAVKPDMLCVLWSIGLVSMLTLCSGTPTPITVQSKAGNIMGFQENVVVDGQQKTITKFLGIPFAESTAGVNKFKKPVPKAKFTGTFDARTESNTCYQGSEPMEKAIEGSYGLKTTYSDDCLKLNIYIPGSVSTITPKPVMIWMYGGGFIQGSTLLYQPDGLVSYGDVIVITVNYRLGMFGFLRDSQGHFPGNQGLWDQQLAIQWVNDNIESFNGIKDNITIFGQSAGSASVLFQAMYPGNRGLFKRVIAQSGTPFSFWAIANESTSDQFIKDEGCVSTDVVTCLQSKDSETFVNNNTYAFGPVIDNDFLISTPSEIINGNSSKSQMAREFFLSVDIVVGVNNQEGFSAFVYFWKPKNALNDTSNNFTISHSLFKDQVVPNVANVSLPPLVSERTKAIVEELLYFTYTNWQNPMNAAALKSNGIALYDDAYMNAGTIKSIAGHAALGSGRTYLYELGFQTLYHLSGMSGLRGIPKKYFPGNDIEETW
ncbi:Neuroligin-1 [Mactra antiquata]